jgi:hypothetical protein
MHIKSNEHEIKSFDKSISHIKKTFSTQRFIPESPESLIDGSILKYLPENKTQMLGKLKNHIKSNYPQCRICFFKFISFRFGTFKGFFK